MTRLDITLSNDLDYKLKQLAKDNCTTTSEILLKSLQLFICARESTRKGMKLKLIDPSDHNKTIEIIGL